MTNTSNKVRINPHLSVLQAGENEVVFSLYGRIKRVRGRLGQAGPWLKQHSIPGGAEPGVAPEAPAGILEGPLETGLLNADVLVRAPEGRSGTTVREFRISGTGRLANLSAEWLQSYYPDVRIRRSGKTPGRELPEGAVTLICPESAQMGDLFDLNRQGLAGNRPFGFLYYDGKHILAGPVVIPRRTPCLECLSTWRRDVLNQHTELHITHDEMGLAMAAFPCDIEADEPAIRAVAMVGNALLSAIEDSDGSSLCRCQVLISPVPLPEPEKIRYEPTAGCPACRGGLSSSFFMDPDRFHPPSSARFSITDMPTCHTDNGYRVLDSGEARALVDTAVSGIGGEIQVTELSNGPLDEVIPSFRASLSVLGGTAIGFGKGTSREQAYLSAAFEAVERLCSEARGTLPMLRAPYSDVKKRAMDIQKRIGTVYFYRNNLPFTASVPVDWVWGQCLYTGAPIMVPAAMVFVGRQGFAGKFYNASTGGIAAGTSLEDALLQGLMETIEHDAWMIWQANAVTCPEIIKTSIEDKEIGRIIRGMENRGYEVRIRYIATETDIPVFRAWLVNPQSVEVFAANGFGCHLNKYLALKRALTEAKLAMPQILYTRVPNTRYMSRGNREILNSRHSLFYLHQFLRTDLSQKGGTLSMERVADLTTGTVAGDIEKTLEILRERIPGFEIAVVNLTDSGLGIPVVRVIPSGLQPLAHPLQAIQDRLFSVPVALGRQEKKLGFRELFNGRYPF